MKPTSIVQQLSSSSSETNRWRQLVELKLQSLMVSLMQRSRSAHDNIVPHGLGSERNVGYSTNVKSGNRHSSSFHEPQRLLPLAHLRRTL